MTVLVGFALAPLLRLAQVPPLRVLKRDLEPLPPGSWLAYGLALTALLLFMWHSSGGGWTVPLLAGSVAVLLALLWLLSLTALAAAKRASTLLGSGWRLGMNRLWRQRGATLTQILAFALVFMAMATLILVRTDLLERWRDRLPEGTPNHFLINILPRQVEPLQAFFRQHGIQASRLYPLVRGRLATINGLPAQEAVPEDARNHNALHRELNLSWTGELPADNRLVAGRWFNEWDRGLPEVSVEPPWRARWRWNRETGWGWSSATNSWRSPWWACARYNGTPSAPISICSFPRACWRAFPPPG
jgi:putative ABC transport system permease protein